MLPKSLTVPKVKSFIVTVTVPKNISLPLTFTLSFKCKCKIVGNVAPCPFSISIFAKDLERIKAPKHLFHCLTYGMSKKLECLILEALHEDILLDYDEHSSSALTRVVVTVYFFKYWQNPMGGKKKKKLSAWSVSKLHRIPQNRAMCSF